MSYGYGGYGGFGYDTSHVPRDDVKSELTKQVEQGNLAAVRQIVEAAASIQEEEKHRVMNHARRWTERDYKMSGFVKTHVWFDITPLATAANKGHHEIVQFLLVQGADPTLTGCPYDDVYWNALEAANYSAVSAGSRRCVDLLKVANLFWGKAKYSGPHYSKDGRKTFTNRPFNGEGLILALKEVPRISSYPHYCLKKEDLECLEAKYASPPTGKSPNKPMKWCCDVCQTAFFTTYEEAVVHERGCAIKKEKNKKGTMHGADHNPNDVGRSETSADINAEARPVGNAAKSPVNAESKTNKTGNGGGDFSFGNSPVAPFVIGGFTSNKQKSKPLFTFGNGGTAKMGHPITTSTAGKPTEPSPTSASEVPFGFSPAQPNVYRGFDPKAFQFGEPSKPAPTPVTATSFGFSTTQPNVSRGFDPKAFQCGEPSKPTPAPVAGVPFEFGPTPFSATPTPQTTPPSSATINKRTTVESDEYTRKSSSHGHASIEAAVSLLESVPGTSLIEYSDRLQKLAHTAHVLSGAPIIQAVFDNNLLLGHILGFEGSLAYYHKHYDMIVGYENPLPYDWSDKYNDIPGATGTPLCDGLKHRPGSKAHLLVCKTWHSFIAGDAGLARWKLDSKNMVAKKISIARSAAKDTSLSWSARICAWAIANDTHFLKAALENPDDESSGIGAALAEQKDESFVPISRGHPFYRHCFCNMVDEDVCYDDRMYAFTTSIAHAAALAGSTEALRLIEPLSADLWTLTFDQKGDGLLNSLVQVACANPTLDCIVESISTILSNYDRKHDFDNIIHQRHYGGNGNHLHLAAARGHAGLVKALINGGMQPNRSCERTVKGDYNDYGEYRSYDDYDSYDDCDSCDSDRSEEQYGDRRDKGVKDNPLPVHWAAIRGHQAIVDLIHTMNGYDDRVKERGRAKTFNHGRGFGFIKRENGGKDIFVHISNIEDGEPLEDGEYVEFTTGQNARGFQALDVTRVEGNSWY